jgi:D-lyxose ketol-isomerase
VLFTLRNGSAAALAHGRGMLYAEKLMITARDQVNPLHRHAVKTEDIINRGGGTLVLQMYNSLPDGNVDEANDVVVATDARLRTLKAGAFLRLSPGESVTLLPGNWHAFWAEGADVLMGEVSTVNDDLTDNYFREPVGRFSTIQEDTKPSHLLVSDYDTWLHNRSQGEIPMQTVSFQLYSARNFPPLADVLKTVGALPVTNRSRVMAHFMPRSTMQPLPH